MRIFKIIIGSILLVLGILYSILSIMSSIEMSPGNSAGEVIGHYIGELLLFYGPSFLLLFFGYRLIRKKKPKKQALPKQHPNPASFVPPVQQQVNTVNTVNKAIETKPTPPPVPKKTVSVECKGCGARKAVPLGESSPCDYCGSPLTA
ncbi:hypothetical protein [Paenibacillus pinisoli]|uniref:hypothetical protein n=1 Tax=Paenibacillus pinisoli TaxID=1276110 RepID=UPI0010586CF9|nr:hypothetical protein [Paenibacillus pinisoli]